MEPESYTHWIEVIIAALVGIGGWLLRLGRREQQHEDRLQHVEADLAEMHRKRAERDAEYYGRLEEISRVQAVQGVQISHIAEGMAEVRRVLISGSPPEARP